MSLSIILEVVIALSFLFAMLSLIASGASELISSALGLRAKMLKKGVKNLLDDPKLAEDIYAHPLIRSLLRPSERSRLGRERPPSYIPSDTFALALLDHTHREAIGAGVEGVEKALEKLGTKSQVGRTLDLLWRNARKDAEEFQKGVEGWFDQSMERVSGWYRRRVQLILFCLGLLIAGILNVSTLTVAQRLWTDAPLRNAAVKQAEEATPPAASDRQAIRESMDNVQAALRSVDALALPIGWGNGAPGPSSKNWDWAKIPLGWLLTAVAISMGAPFWFDLLGRVARLRSTGVRLQTAKPKSAETENKPEPDEGG